MGLRLMWSVCLVENEEDLFFPHIIEWSGGQAIFSLVNLLDAGYIDFRIKFNENTCIWDNC